jgi:peptidoglycan/LPS O-acetylase OafA/YrhL
LHLLTGLAVICVVVNHALGWSFTSLFWWTDRYAPVTVPDFSALGTPRYYALRVLEQLVTFPPSAFIFVSGFFVAFAAGRDAGRLSWATVRSRLTMLLIPYFLWSIAIFVGRRAEGAGDSLAGYVHQLLVGRAAEPYYYIPLITQLYLLAPLAVVWLNKYPKTILAGAAVAQFGVQAARYPVILGIDNAWAISVWRYTPGWFFPHMAFWFVFGIFVGFRSGALRQWLVRWRRVLPWVTLLLAVAAVFEWELLLRHSGRDWLTPTPTALDSLYSLAIILTFMALAESSLTLSRPLNALGARAFGVYLIHAPVLELFSRASYHATPLLLGHQVVFVSLLVAVGVGVPLVLMAIVNRTPVRPCYNYLFG